MHLWEKIKPYIKILKVSGAIGTGCLIFRYEYFRTIRSIDKIINPEVLDRERKLTAEFIYINDPAYDVAVSKQREMDTYQTIGLQRIWKSLKHSLAWRLLWLCKYGNTEQRNVALNQLAAFKDNKDWACLKIAQALDENTAVLLARTHGADVRYFLPPPLHIRKAALSPDLLSFKLRDMLMAVQHLEPHSCIEHFLSKYFFNEQQSLESDTDIGPTKPGSASERSLCLLCLDALQHHFNLFHSKNYNEDQSIQSLIQMGLLHKLAEVMLRNRYDIDIDLAVLRILTVLSVYTNLLTEFHQTGLIGELCRLIKSKDVRLSSSAAVCLANLSGEHCYRPGLYVLHPLYRTSVKHTCDTLLVHGLRGGVFVTWRQRDINSDEPVGLMDVTVQESDCDVSPQKSNSATKYLDADLQQVMADLIEIQDEALLADIEVVLQDLPISAKREPASSCSYTALKKIKALRQEEEDACSYTYCWPKDWLPQDFNNLRILGVNYWSSLSEWLEHCPLQTAEISVRAEELWPTLIDAGVGQKNIPIVWLAHSMGGLIVKQLLNESADSTNKAFRKFCANTKAIVFFSTPHKGSILATMPRAASAILWPSNDVTQLQVGSSILEKLQKTFLEHADTYGWETVSFAESKPTLVTAFKVPVLFVEPVSADLGRGVFYELPLDHLSICKPATRQSILYTTVLDIIDRITYRNAHENYTQSFIEYILDWIWWLIQRKAWEVAETIDENHNNDGLKWFEKVLIDIFTDGFTD